MISQPPTPWFDIITCELTSNCLKFSNHYVKDISVRYTGICQCCKKESITHMHHIIPRCYLGSHKYSNLIELCPSCHKKTESGILEIKGGKYFNWGIKKKHKIQLKLYKENIDLNNNCYITDKLKFIIRKHLSVDSAIKYLIKTKKYNQINKLFIELEKEGIVKKNI